MERGEVLYRFAWRNRFDGKRHGHVCRLIARLPLNSALVEWVRGGRDIISRNALRRER